MFFLFFFFSFFSFFSSLFSMTTNNKNTKSGGIYARSPRYHMEKVLKEILSNHVTWRDIG